jgi:uncharacterized RDD family membrane protein YckC
MKDGSWYWSENGEKSGPFSHSLLAELLSSGELEPDTWVWTDGLDSWEPANSLETFSHVFAQPPPQVLYAGFWRRFLAFLIDHFIFLPFLIILLVSTLLLIAMLGGPMNEDIGEFIGSVIGCIGSWLYYALFESSSLQATPGKRALSLRVFREDGEPLSFGRASGRHFAKSFSGLLFCIGYLMAAWTARKQALHDLVADCLVVKE